MTTAYGEKRKILTWLHSMWLLFTVVVVFIIALFVTVVWKAQIRSASQNMQDTLSIYAQAVDNEVRQIDSYLYLNFNNNEDLRKIELHEPNAKLAKYELSKMMSSILGWCNSICQIMFIHPDGANPASIRTNGGIPYYESVEIFDKFCETCMDTEQVYRDLSRGCTFIEMDNAVYIVKYYRISKSYFGVVVNTDRIYSDLSELTRSGKQILLADPDMQICSTSAPDLNISSVNQSENGTFLEIGNRNYLFNKIQLSWGGFYICELAEKGMVIQEVLNLDYRWLLFIITLFLACYGFSVFFVRNYVTRPIANLIEGMESFGEGDLQTQVETGSQIHEIYQMETTFNGMTTEIRDLKIQNYETQIETQKAQLQYLQLQTNPHFYLNALNIIYSLAQIQDFETIQKISLHLVNYSRYMFHDVTSMVTLKQELQHVEEYIHIQEIRFGSEICYSANVEKQILNALIPPFVVQSFVENSIKYAFKMHQDMKIFLDGRLDGNNILLTIRDTGEGYSSEILQKINNGKNAGEDMGEHIGIRNVQKRLALVYGKRASIAFENDNGAVTRIRIPCINA